MADPKWEETAPVQAAPAESGGSTVPTWEETQPLITGPEASPVTAATTGLAQGASLGWAPAIGAASRTAMDAITGTNGPLAGGDLDDLVDEYRRQRDELRGKFAKAAAVHPRISAAANLAGGVASLGAVGPAAMTSKGLAATGAAMGAGGVDINEASDIPKAALAAGEGAVSNLAMGKIAEAAAPVIGKVLKPVGNAVSSGIEGVSDWLGGHAEDLAEKATGATGAQAAKFQEGTGRELLDRGIVGFGDSPGDIAANANAAMDSAQASKQDIVENQLQDTKVDRNTVYNYIRNKINALKGDESQVGLVKALESKLEDITGVADQSGTEVPLAQSEDIRRGFDKAAKWDSNTDAPTRDASKIVANAYREAGEQAATATNPELGAQFKADKSTQSLLIPVAEAAEKRASQLNQSPHGGLLDMAAAGAGAAVGGPIGAVGGLALKQIRPRLASAGAVSADNLSKIVASTPHLFGKFSGVLQSAAARGATSLGATDYILQQSNPDYREQRKKIFQTDEEELQPSALSDAGEGQR